MAKESSHKKGVAQQATSRAHRQPKSAVIQQHEEIISKEELIERKGIVRGKKGYFNMYLNLFFKENIIRDPPITIQRLAEHLYNKKELYVHKGNEYKSMKFSSILTELNTLSQSVQDKLKKEKKKTPKKR